MPSLNPIIHSSDAVPACTLCAGGHSSSGSDTLLHCTDVRVRRHVDGALDVGAHLALSARDRTMRLAVRDAIERRTFVVRAQFGSNKRERAAFHDDASARLDALLVAVFDETYRPMLAELAARAHW